MIKIKTSKEKYKTEAKQTWNSPKIQVGSGAMEEWASAADRFHSQYALYPNRENAKSPFTLR